MSMSSPVPIPGDDARDDDTNDPDLTEELPLTSSEAAEALRCSEVYFWLVHAPHLPKVSLSNGETDEDVYFLLGDVLRRAAEVSTE